RILSTLDVRIIAREAKHILKPVPLNIFVDFFKYERSYPEVLLEIVGGLTGETAGVLPDCLGIFIPHVQSFDHRTDPISGQFRDPDPELGKALENAAIDHRAD